MGHSYKEQVTAEHDAFCIAASLKSALENARDAEDFSITLDQALENAYGYLAEGMQHCRCMFAGLKGEAKLAHLDQFSDDAVSAMTQGGYRNDSTGELMTITWAEYLEFHAYRTEKLNDWEAKFLADEIVGDQNSYASTVASDTEPQASYSLLVNGSKSSHGTWVTKWGIAYAVVRELQAINIDPELNTGFIMSVLDTINPKFAGVRIIENLRLTVVFEGQ